MRKLTKNADAAYKREINGRLRRELREALKEMSDADKLLLTNVVNSYNSGTSGVGLASAFEMELHSMWLVVLHQSEYDSLCERLKEAEAFQKKVLFMPDRQSAA